MKYISLLSVGVAATCMLATTAAEAGRNNHRFNFNAFNGSQLATSEALAEATALKRDAQERRDERERIAREGDFATRSTFNDFLNRAQTDMFDAGPGDTGSGLLNGTSYSWSVSATQRIFILDGTISFIVDCGGGGC